MERQIKCFPDKVKSRSSSSPSPYYMKCYRDLSKKKKVKNKNSKMTTNSQLSTTEPKNKNKNKIIKQLVQKQNLRNRDYMESYEQGGSEGE